MPFDKESFSKGFAAGYLLGRDYIPKNENGQDIIDGNDLDFTQNSSRVPQNIDIPSPNSESA